MVVALALEDAGHGLPRRGRHHDRLEAAGKARVRKDDGLEQVALAADLSDRRQVGSDRAALVADGVTRVAGRLGIVEQHLAADVIAAADAGQQHVQLPGLACRVGAPGGQQLLAAPPDRLRISGEAWPQQLRRARSTVPWRATARRAAPHRSSGRPTGRTPAAAVAAPCGPAARDRGGQRQQLRLVEPRLLQARRRLHPQRDRLARRQRLLQQRKDVWLDARQPAADRRQGLETERNGPPGVASGAQQRGLDGGPVGLLRRRGAQHGQRQRRRPIVARRQEPRERRYPCWRQRLQARPRHRTEHERPVPARHRPSPLAPAAPEWPACLRTGPGGARGAPAPRHRPAGSPGARRSSRRSVSPQSGWRSAIHHAVSRKAALARVEERHDRRRRQTVGAHLVERDERRPARTAGTRPSTPHASTDRHRSRSTRRSRRARRRDRAASRPPRARPERPASPRSGRAPRPPPDARADQRTRAVRSAPHGPRIAPEAEAMRRDALDTRIAITQRRPDGVGSVRQRQAHRGPQRSLAHLDGGSAGDGLGQRRHDAAGTEARQRLDGAAPHRGPRVVEAADQRRRRLVPPVETTSARVGDRCARRASARDRSRPARPASPAATSGSTACTSRRCRRRAGCRRRPRARRSGGSRALSETTKSLSLLVKVAAVRHRGRAASPCAG